MADDEPIMGRIHRGMALVHAGRREEARAVLANIWRDVGDEGAALHRCILAQVMGDLQENARDELAWRLRAVEAAEALSDDAVNVHFRGVVPSLHVSIGEAYCKLGDVANARRHLLRAEGALASLDDDAYTAIFRRAITRLAERIAHAPS